MNNNVNSRELIVTMLLSISSGEEYSHILIKNVLDKYDYLDTKEKAFIKNVTEGSIERRIEIDYIIDSFSKTPVSKMKPFIRELLRMSVYQLLFLDRIPASAAINEAVKLAKKKGFTGLSGFVNGVLRNVDRKRAEIKYPAADTIKGRSVRFSMPEWIIAEFDSYVGKDKADKAFEAFLETRPVVIRVSEKLSKDETKKLVSDMEAAGAKVTPQGYGERIFTLKDSGNIAALPGYDEGKFTVQDVSSQVCVMAAGIKPGDTVLDVCAAPGGKSVYAAELAGDKGRVISRDLTPFKTALIRENAERLGVKNITVEEWDATDFDESLEGKADVVIADLPCMGFGIMGRKRDIKFNTLKEGLEEIVKLQRQILSTVSRYVKKGGRLIFSTCSVSKSENEDGYNFIKDELGLKPFDLTANLDKNLVKAIEANGELDKAKEGRLQLLPCLYDSDGFFIAGFTRE